MSDSDKKNSACATEESVDDILAGILNPDGSFNDDFNGLFARYVGGAQTSYPVRDVDLSDRRDDIRVSEKVEYEAEDAFVSPERTADERIGEKIPDSIKTAFSEAAKDAQRPEFTASGDVRYPTMGVGASEQRVVYDADWEESAKKEAARRERVRQDRMLRGDSAYARGFVTRDPYETMQSPYVPQTPASPYIDPLSRDSDLERPDVNSEYFSSTKKSFFPEGFSVVQRNSVASSGKTEKYGSGPSAYRTAFAGGTDTSWLQVDEKPDKKKKKSFFGKKKKSTGTAEESFPVEETIRAAAEKVGVSEEDEPPAKPHTAFYDGEKLEDVKEETAGLRSTVAEIVDKYNKRTEEEEKRKLEELARREELRREEELRERRRLEEIRILKGQMSPELCEAIESAEPEEAFDEYDDFSTVPAEKTESTSKKNFGVVFDPKALSGDEYTEKLDSDKSSSVDDGTVYTEALTVADTENTVLSEEKDTKKKKKKKKR